MSRLAYIPRMSGIMLAVAAAVLLAGNPMSVLMMTLVSFVAVEVGFSIWSMTTTLSLPKIIPAGKKEGSVLGVNSAIIGAGLLIGSIAAAGEVAASFGYCWVTFALVIAFLAASFVLVSKFFNKTVVAMTTTIAVAKAAI
jgi:predicted MFS family arabinose efflux permease